MVVVVIGQRLPIAAILSSFFRVLFIIGLKSFKSFYPGIECALRTSGSDLNN
jgi:hypothetical protein